MGGIVEILVKPPCLNQIVLREGSTRFTCSEVVYKVQKIARLILKSGLKRIALHADNSAAWILTDLACQEADVLCLPLPLFFSAQQRAYALQSCGIEGVFTATPELFAEQFPVSDYIADLPLTLMKTTRAITPDLPQGTSKVTFTSGSTGTPKGVCLSATQQLLQAKALAEAVGIEHPVHLCVLPLSTLLENIAGVYAPLQAGGTVIVKPLHELGFSGSRLVEPQKFLQALLETRPDSIILIPQLLHLLVHAVKQGWKPPPLQFIAVGGSKVSAALITQARALGLPVYEGYGLSECASVVSLNRPSIDEPGSCGKPLAHAHVDIRQGEIVVSGNTMLGYVGEPDSWHPAEILTGDLGHFDAQGFLHINGRKKNLLISSYGRNISPEWVESELLSSPVLAEAVLFGDARPYCVALLRARHPETPDALLDAAVSVANSRLPDYARVKHWVRLDKSLAEGDGLLTENGRPRRARIEQKYHQQIETAYSRNPESL
ncbi:MAG: AMP-binding protein [Pseudomonadota bacterium]